MTEAWFSLNSALGSSWSHLNVWREIMVGISCSLHSTGTFSFSTMLTATAFRRRHFPKCGNYSKGAVQRHFQTLSCESWRLTMPGMEQFSHDALITLPMERHDCVIGQRRV